MPLRASLASKFYLLLAAAMIVASLSIAGAALVYRSSAADFERQGHQRDQTDTLLLQTVSDFRAQVQQFKDMLLRGQDPQQRALYWTRFETLERSTERDADALLALAPASGERDLLDEFIQAHQQAGLVYRAGLHTFENSGGNALEADLITRGVDRYPSGLLMRVSEEAARSARQSLQDAAADARRNLMLTLILGTACAVLMLAVAIWTVQLWVVQPARALVAQLDRLSAGDLSARIESVSQDEIGVIARRIDSIRRALDRIVAQER